MISFFLAIAQIINLMSVEGETVYANKSGWSKTCQQTYQTAIIIPFVVHESKSKKIKNQFKLFSSCSNLGLFEGP